MNTNAKAHIIQNADVTLRKNVLEMKKKYIKFFSLGMTCSLVLLLGITISVSAKTYMNVVPGNSELNSLRSDEPDDYEAGRRQHLLWPNDRSRENRERLLKLIVNFLDDDTLEKIGIKNMGEFSEAESKRAPFR